MVSSHLCCRRDSIYRIGVVGVNWSLWHLYLVMIGIDKLIQYA